jgi:phenylacetate-CoA ligase
MARFTLRYRQARLKDLFHVRPALRAEEKLILRAERDPELYRSVRDQRLAAMVRHAFATCPIYHERFDREQVEAFSRVEDLPGLPTVCRRDLQRQMRRFVAQRDVGDDYAVVQTSGSTGEPIRVLKDLLSHRFYDLLIKQAVRRFGVSVPFRALRPSLVFLTGLEGRDNGRRLQSVLGYSRMYQLALKGDGWDSPQEILELLASCDAFVLSSDPASLTQLIEHSRAHDAEGRFPVRPRLIYSTSRPLLAALRREIEAFFGCPIVDAYSVTEVGPVAMQCPAGGGFHVEGLAAVVECLRPDGTPAAPDEVGELVITNLRNPVFPLIRYRVGDFGILAEGQCGCGSAFPRIEAMISRAGVQFVRPDGTGFEPPIVMRRLRELPLYQCQVEQTSVDRFVFRYVPEDGADTLDLNARARRIFDEVLEAAVEVECQPMDAIGEPGKKVQPYISTIPDGNG